MRLIHTDAAPWHTSTVPGRSIPLIIFHGTSDSTVDMVNADHLVRQGTGALRGVIARAAREERPGRRPSTRTVFSGPDGQDLSLIHI